MKRTWKFRVSVETEGGEPLFFQQYELPADPDEWLALQVQVLQFGLPSLCITVRRKENTDGDAHMVDYREYDLEV